ncbi:MAG: hypothetical protein ABSF29_14370 [Tepidisphaeraceae bacterium]
MAVVTVITTVWVSAWSKAVVDEANRSWWPAGPVHQQQVDARKPIVVAEP